jgi:hypothetical protein
MPIDRPSLVTLAGAVAALALLPTCAPEYRSGATACGPTAPRCPEGFVCSGIRCYLPGDVPKDGGVLGTGGAAGMGGNAGMGGAGGGGAGGAGGAAGTGGTPASGGVGGTGMGGRGGSSTGGTGGTAMYPMFPPAPMCATLRPANVCSACRYSLCCGELQACLGNAACQTFVTCVNGCNSDRTCEDACVTSNQAGFNAFLPFPQCSQAKCAQPCGTPPPASTDAGGPPPPQDAGPAPPPPPGGASAMKFCNDLYIDDGTPQGRAINLELQLGALKLNTLSGTCVPLPGTACTTIPTGNQMLVFRDPADGEVIVQQMVNIVASTNYVFIGHYPQSEMRPIVTTLPTTAAECSAYSPDDLP